MPQPTKTWDTTYETDPADTQPLSQGALRMRELKDDAGDRGNPEHHWRRTSAEAFSGEHRMGSARICVGTAANRAAMQFVVRTADILPGLAGHEGGVDNVVKINNPHGLYFFETDTGLVYYHNGTVWTLQPFKGDYANALSNVDADSVLTLTTTFRTPALSAFRVKSPTTAGLRVNVGRGLYVDTDGTVREYAGNTDFLLGAAPGVGNDRIDLLYLAGVTLTELQGTAGASPRSFPADAPAIPPTAFPLAYIYRRASDTAFNEVDAGGATAFLLRDVRGIMNKPSPRTHALTEAAQTAALALGVAYVLVPGMTAVSLTLKSSTSIVRLAAVLHFDIAAGATIPFGRIIDTPGAPVVHAEGRSGVIDASISQTADTLYLHRKIAGWSGSKTFEVQAKGSSAAGSVSFSGDIKGYLHVEEITQ